MFWIYWDVRVMYIRGFKIMHENMWCEIESGTVWYNIFWSSKGWNKCDYLLYNRILWLFISKQSPLEWGLKTDNIAIKLAEYNHWMNTGSWLVWLGARGQHSSKQKQLQLFSWLAWEVEGDGHFFKSKWKARPFNFYCIMRPVSPFKVFYSTITGNTHKL